VDRLLPRFRRQDERIEDERKVAQIVAQSETLDIPTTVARATLPGDVRRMRGIPMVSRGTAGTSPGTSPLGALLRKEAKSAS
jgi:hypothetical protein